VFCVKLVSNISVLLGLLLALWGQGGAKRGPPWSCKTNTERQIIDIGSINVRVFVWMVFRICCCCCCLKLFSVATQILASSRHVVAAIKVALAAAIASGAATAASAAAAAAVAVSASLRHRR